MIWFVTSKPVAGVWGIICLLIAGACVWTGFSDPGDAGLRGMLAMAALFFAVAWASLLRCLPERPERRVAQAEFNGQPALVFRLSLKGPLAMLVFCSVLVALFLALWGAEIDDPGGWLVVPVCVVFGLWAVQGAWGLSRRPRIIVTADELVYHGIELEARTRWDAVIGIGHDADVKARRFYVRVSCSADSDVVRGRVLRLPSTLSTDVIRDAPVIDLNDGLLRLPGFYVQVLGWFVDVPREERARLIATLADEPGDHRAA